MAVRTTLFRSGGRQAVRLPKDIAFPPAVREVLILREGERRILVPADGAWTDFFDSPGTDVAGRDQPALQKREPL